MAYSKPEDIEEKFYSEKYILRNNLERQNFSAAIESLDVKNK